MCHQMVICAVFGALIARGVFAQTTDATDAAADNRLRLADRIEEDWPQSGHFVARFQDKLGNDLEVGYDFESRAWFRISHHEEGVSGRDPAGRGFSGRAAIDGVKEQVPHEGADWLLDNVFPELGLVGVLRDTRRSVTIRERPDGGWEVVASLPRASRYPIEGLHAVEIERWGGPQGMFRDVVYLVRPDRTVESITAPTRHTAQDPRVITREFDVSADSPPGFQVVRTHPPPGEMALTSIRFGDEPTEDVFSREGVLRRAIDRRVERHQRIPVISAAQADAEPDQPTPIRGERRAMTTSSLAWVGAGGVLVLLGLAAWWRARRA